MPATVQEAVEIQVQVSGRRPRFEQQAAALAAPNGRPSGNAGVSVAGASGRSAVDVAVALIASDPAASWALRLWGYYDALSAWCVIDNSVRAGLDNWTQIMRGGPIDRVYVEIMSVGGGTLDIHVGPCDVP